MKTLKSLKKKIIKYFVLCAFAISVIESILNSTFETFVFPKFDESGSGLALPGFLNIAATFVFFFIFAFVFYRLTGKAIAAESKRQVQLQNSQYARITHDLKTPMTSVQGFAAALRDGKIKPEEQGEIFDIIYNKSCYMNELVESMFAYSKLETDEYAMTFSEHDVCALVRSMAAVYYDEFETRGMELMLEIPETPVFAMSDEKEMKRCIGNLMANAYKHNIDGAKILIQVYEQSGNVYVAVADNGKPIPAELKQHIFEPFVSGNEARTSGTGTGLGLAISRLIAQKHGGDLAIREDIGGFTKGFVVKIPPAGKRKRF